MHMKWTKFLTKSALLVATHPAVSAAQTGPAVVSAGNTQTGGGHILPAIIITAVTFGVFMALAKTVDWYRARENERVALQGKVTDALFGYGEAVSPTVHIPLWGHSPATIEMAGVITASSQLPAILQRASRAAAEVRPDFAIRNKIILAEGPELRAA